MVVALLFLVLASYQSFVVRRILTSPIYRRRALWTGLGAPAIIPYGLLIILGDLGFMGATASPFSGPHDISIFVVFLVLTIVDTLVLFGWIDSTIGVAQELDFFHTDTFRWKRLRKVAWAFVVVGAVVGGAATNPLLYLLGGVILGVPITYAAIVLAKSAPRVHDETMRRHLRWVGLIVAAVIAELVTGTISFNLNFPLVFFGYFLYRAAGSLSIRSQLEEGPLPPTK